MSQPPTPPPIPQAPIPVQPLSYVPPPTYARPGILTAVAVISIVIASLSLMVSGGTTLYGFMMTVASGMARSSSATATVVPPTPAPVPTAGQPTAPVTSDEDADEDGLPTASRKIVVDALATMRPLSPTRQKHLDALLALAGKKILPLSGDAVTARAIRANVTDTGQFPSGTGKASAGADYFAVALGRIEVDDRHAVFYPVGAGEVLRASASKDDTESSDTADATDAADSTATTPTPSTPPAPATFGDPLTEKEIRQVIKAIETRAAHKLNANQSRTLRAQLKTPGQMIFTPATGGAPLASQINAATWSNGTFVLVTNTGSIVLPANGGVTMSGGFGRGGPSLPNVMLQAVLVIISSGLSFLLAILLLVAGIMTIRNSQRARKLHLAYAYLKLPIGIADILAWAWLWYAFMRGIPGGGVNPTWAVSIFFSAPALLGLLYPIALLIVMHTRSVKAYYSPVVSQ